MLDNRRRLLAVSVCVVLLLGLQISLVQAQPVSTLTTTIVVTNTTDSGPGSLRNAIGAAQPGATIAFSLPVNSTIILSNGELTVTVPITLDGSTASSLVIDANHASRVISATAPLMIRSLSILNGSAPDGGGIYATAALTLSEVVLSGNAATNNGGGVYAASATMFDGSTLINNTAKYGGGAYLLGASTISGTQFYGNVVTNGGGGLLTHAPVSMTLAHFAGNSADNGAGIGTGGGLQASNSGLLRITQSTFSYNHANGASDDGGGALMLYAGASLELRDSSLYSNTSASFGGAISSITTTSSITLINTSSYLNSAALNGGAVRSTGPLTLTAAHFLTNTAGSGGGVLAQTTAMISGCLFQANQATGSEGGGMLVVGALDVIDTQFIGNHSAGAEGGLATGNASANLTNVQFISNSAVFEAGAFANLGVATITNGLFRGNQGVQSGAVRGAQLTLVDSQFDNNFAATEAGAILANQLTLVNTRFYTNTAGSNGGAVEAIGPLTIMGGLFQNNHTVSVAGGAVIAQSTAQISGSQFISNSAAAEGGAVRSVGAVTITGGLFQGNHSDLGGGGLSVVGRLTMTDTQLIHNTSLRGGGAVAYNQVDLTRGKFEDNHATSLNGGGLSVQGPLNVTGTQFISNTAQASGGGVLANGPVALQQAVFQGNLSATSFGGGLYAFSTLNLTRSSFVGNGALRGGGLYHASGNADVINSLFARNTAPISGTAIYLGSTGNVNLEYLTVGNAALTLGSAIEVAQGAVNLYDSIVTNQAIGLRNTGGTVLQDYNLFFGDTVDTVGSVSGGTHNVSGDPKLVDAAHDNYHLGAGSAAIDHAIDLGSPIDFDGDARPFGTGFDIGFDEYSVRFVYLPLIKR